MKKTYTPLRYPGGKNKLAKQFEEICRKNNISTFIEPYTGGAGISLFLLLNNTVNNIILNDLDPLIYSFWYSVLNHNAELINMIQNTDITMDNWYKYKEIIINYNNYDKLTVGFATFFMNRTNRSGIIKGGVMGGKNQNSKYKITDRFNKLSIIEKIKNIYSKKDNIILYNLDAVTLINNMKEELNNQTLIYFDPPYYHKAEQLYNYSYNHKDHLILNKHIQQLNTPYILSYDNADEISSMYNNMPHQVITLPYSISKGSIKGDELIIYNHIII